MSEQKLRRITNLELGKIDTVLTEKDRSVLEMIGKLRFIKTSQLQRIFYPIKNSKKTALSNMTLLLHRLERYGLIEHTKKQVRNDYTDSKEYIWYLTETGKRIQKIGTEAEGKRGNYQPPAFTFSRHTIAVNECYVQIVEFCRNHKELAITSLDVEPDCWRLYDVHGKTYSLRPDLYASIRAPHYADYLFIEMDLNTESIPIIVEKCRRYYEYRATGKEQQRHKIFPVVVWLVPSEERKRAITTALKGNFLRETSRFMLVITPDELEETLLNGAKKEDLC